MSVLPDHEIRALALQGMIEPFRADQLQPSSYDVRLGTTFRVVNRYETTVVDLDLPETFRNLTVREYARDALIIHPGEAVIAQTQERVQIPNGIVARIEGKSSIARLFLIVHMAGFIDPGYHGVVTLEMVNFLPVPIRVRPGNLIAQLSFTRMTSRAERPYAGRYQGDAEATASRYGS